LKVCVTSVAQCLKVKLCQVLELLPTDNALHLRAEADYGQMTPNSRQFVSGMSVVIHGQEYPFGILRVYPSQQQTFTKNDIYFLQAVANVLAAAIELQRVETARKNIQAELHQQYRRSQLFADITLKIRQSLQIDEILLARSKLILLSRFSSKINCGDS